MSAPKGNEFWKKRSKHGREKIFATPNDLWEAAVEYFEYTDSRTWNKIDFKGKEVERVEIPVSAPYTLIGLYIFLGVNKHYFNDFKAANKDFSDVIETIEQIIYTQKFEGATVGVYNANIIARDLGLADKQEATVNHSLNIFSRDQEQTDIINNL